MNDAFLRACRGEPVEHTPVWLKRQAGRYLPEFMAIYRKMGFLNMCRTAEIAAEVTIQPVDIIGVDAAIIFSDITTTVVPMGMHLEYDDLRGPYYPDPISSAADVDRLIVPDVADDGLSFVYDAIRICADELADRVPLIGFAGAPLAMASFMVEGAMSRNYIRLRRMMFSDQATFLKLMDKITQHTTNYLRAQAAAGAQALMLFDSFAGIIGPLDFEELNLPFIERTFTDLQDTGVPLIYFGLGAHASLSKLSHCGADVISVDYGLSLSRAIETLGEGVSVQGNLDPFVLFQSRDQIEKRVKATLAEGKAARGHVFNLGHGVMPGTPVDGVRAMVDAVHAHG